MHLSKNKKYQYTFFLLILIYSIFNGGNSNLLIQLNFILISLFYIFCLKDKNYNIHLGYFFRKNKRSIYFYILFLFYLSFQIIPLPIEIIKIISPAKYLHLSNLKLDLQYSSISLSPVNSLIF